MTWLRRVSLFVLTAAVLSAIAYQHMLVSYTQVHWDEFYFLSKVHAYQAGWWAHTLQSIYVHIYSWLTLAGPNEVDQVMLGRRFSVVCLTSVTAGSLFLCVRRLTGSVSAALAATFVGIGHPYAAFQAFRFRADPILCAGFLAIATLLILAGEQRKARLWAALILGAVGALSIKAVFFVPSLTILLLLRQDGNETWKTRGLRLVEFGFAAALAAGILLGLHHLALAEVGLANSQELANRAAEQMFGEFLPRKRTLTDTLLFEQEFWSPMGWGLLVAIGSAIVQRGKARRAALATLAMCLPLTIPFFYRNAFSYFYVCIIPPASFAVGWLVHTAEHLLARWAPKRLRMADWGAAVAVLPLLVLLYQQSERDRWDTVSHQREFLDVVRQVFPQSVPYLDRCSMVASYPKVGPFLTTWRLQDLRDGGQPSIQDQVRSAQPLFVVNNMTGLDLAQDSKDQRATLHYIPSTDFRFLQRHYVQHAGPLWVAGKKLYAMGMVTRFKIVIEGTYTLESEHPVLVDKEALSPGESRTLSVGTHKLQVFPERSATELTLRIGTNLVRPTLSEPDRDLLVSQFHPYRPYQVRKR